KSLYDTIITMPNHEELIDILLKNRGIIDKNKFLNPKYEDLYDPYLLKDMEIAVVRIFEAIEAKEKIIIYSDYDCDGIPSAVIMDDFFKKIGYENFSVYIPHRHDEGYGLHKEAIDGFINDGVNLLITFDLGITAINEVAQAKAGGIDVIIVDHHLPSSLGTPKAYAVIDPKQDDCKYPYKMLCGAGLAFKLIQALLLKYQEYWKINEGWEKWLLDMAGIATLSDQVPLLDENRILAYYGLKVLKKTRRPGLVEIFRKASVDISKLNEEDITFTLAPRLNAASRMANPMDAFEVLATNDPVLAKTLSNHLVKINDERKQLVAHIMKEVKKTLSKRSLSQEEIPVIVIGNPKWRVGVLGIVAAKITEEYKRPVFVWGGDESDTLRGSCRSYGDINLVEIMNLLPEDSLLEFGGHKMAGGFSVSHEEIHFLEERIVSIFPKIEKEGTEGRQETELPIDSIIEIDDITNENYKVIEKLAPFGEGNPKPTFLIKKAKIYSIKEFGKEKNHLEIIFKNSRGSNVKAIAFFKTNESFNNYLETNKEIDLIVNFEKNTFAGRTELRLRIIDIIIK
ncbi:MAG: single-stranded-DNA-specific exonuclease RecJ, partial [Candidatus Pacebacteria bacterium]|nr:single-stranded-DNA-specific exonuclease RecJ [Candidatus Paceibacterota bacterium]